MNPEDRKVMEMARDAVGSTLEDAHNRAGLVCCNRPGYECCGSPRPEWSEADAKIMNMLGPIHKAIEERLRADEPEFGPVNLNDVEPDRLQADEKERPKPGDVIGHAKLVYTGRMPPRKFDVEEDEKEEPVACPMQPIALDEHGRPRFRANEIVLFILDHGPFSMNDLAVQEFSDEDRMQFAQLIGYSVSGYSELSYVSDESYERAERIAAALRSREEG